MDKKLRLEAGKIINTHGARGEVKLEPWADSPEFLLGLKRLYIDGSEVAVKSMRTHGRFIIAALEGVDDIDGAVRLKNKLVFLDRSDIELQKDAYFIQDIIGFDAIDADTGEKLGTLSDVLPLPAGNVYEIQGERTILVPAVPEFVIETNPEAGFIRLRLIEGM